jgi:hypothetical protein
MPDTFTLIASSTVGSGGASTISFSSIPSTYTDLVLELSLRGTATGLPDARIQFNGDTGSNYQAKELSGNGATVSSNGYTTTDAHFHMGGTSTTANTFTNTMIYIPNYAGSTQKSFSGDAINENNTTNTEVQGRLVSWLWTNTSAINAILLSTNTGNYAQYSTAYLYGVKNA